MSDQDIDAIAVTIWGEMRGLGTGAMHAVANVIMNRVAKQSWYGLTPYEVCMKSRHGVYQFDCNNPNDPNFEKCLDVTIDDPQFAEAMQIAVDACNGCLPDITRGSLNYYSKTIPMPYWAKDKTPAITIGNTEFFNNIN